MREDDFIMHRFIYTNDNSGRVCKSRLMNIYDQNCAVVCGKVLQCAVVSCSVLQGVCNRI